jgi:hypothetical protein
MSASQFNDRRPTPLEEQAHAEVRTHFAEHLKQLPASQGAIKTLERNLSTIALTVNMAAARSSPSDSSLRADDGSHWHKGAVLFDNIVACHQHTEAGVEYAVVEQFPNGRNEIWTQGRNAVEVLRNFAGEQKRALQIWTDDLAARVKEFLGEKYPGQDMSRVADGFMHRLAQSEHRAPQQQQSRGIRI